VAPTEAVKLVVRFLTLEQVVEMHDDLLRRFGGLGGGGARGGEYEGVDAAVQAVKNSYYDSVEELAAAYAVYIVQGHVFTDGNKRTGAAAMLVFLEANGIRSTLSADEVPGLMIDLQRRSEAGERTEDLIGWIAAALRARRPTPRRGKKREK
jgi:death-on-curing protein